MQLDSDGEVISSGDESDRHSGSDAGEAFGGGDGAPLAPEARALQAGLLVARFEAAGAGGNDWVTSKLFCRTLAGWVREELRTIAESGARWQALEHGRRLRALRRELRHNRLHRASMPVRGGYIEMASKNFGHGAGRVDYRQASP